MSPYKTLKFSPFKKDNIRKKIKIVIFVHAVMNLFKLSGPIFM